MTATPKDWIPEDEYQRMINVLTEVSYERKRIFSKYGTRNFSPVIWLPILIEEVGEVGQAICEVEHGPGLARRGHMLNLRNELIQVAAVAVAMVESLDRNELKNNTTPKHD